MYSVSRTYQLSLFKANHFEIFTSMRMLGHNLVVNVSLCILMIENVFLRVRIEDSMVSQIFHDISFLASALNNPG